METAHLPNGTLLQGGKYKIVRFIGSGGFGCTYEGEHTMLGSKVAIKEFFVKDFCNREETTSHVTVGTTEKKGLVEKLLKKFVEEARFTAGLRHPNIARVSDVFEENDTAYYVMDYMEGQSLDKIVKENGPLKEETALEYIRQIADALGYVHSLNRLHLDVKPGNIMTDERGNAVLIDFGASKQYDEVGGENTSTLMGKTPGYAPIEQMGNTVTTFTPATDIYALGATLYKLLTGTTPLEATMLASGEELAPLPSNISASTANAISSAMQLAKSKRPQTISEFIALLSFKDKESKSFTPPTPPTPPTNTGEETTFDGGHGEPEPEQQKTEIGQQPELKQEKELNPDFQSKSNQPQKKKSRKGGKVVAIIFGVLALAFGIIVLIDTSCPSIYGTPASGQANGHDYVDLGLSVKWATCNVGANLPSGYGNAYAWGETKTKSVYTIENSVTYSKNFTDIANSPYDAARANWGGNWRMPTEKEMWELIYNCEWKWRKMNGVKGFVVSRNGKSIFLPAEGYKSQKYGNYWCSTPSNSTSNSFRLHFSKCFLSHKWSTILLGTRSWGLSIRPVIAQTTTATSSQTGTQTSTSSTATTSNSTQTSTSTSTVNKTSSTASSSGSSTTQQGSKQTSTQMTTSSTVSTSSKSVSSASGYINGYGYVDLGLSVKWATCNVGASSPSSYGNYYAWGEIKTKSNYTTNSSVTFDKQIGDIAGNLQYDAASANFGGTWRMPTAKEIEELVNKCKWEWISLDGIMGYKVTGRNGKSIFLPAAGWRDGTSISSGGKHGDYWSATSSIGPTATGLNFNNEKFYIISDSRAFGRSIRPVTY